MAYRVVYPERYFTQTKINSTTGSEIITLSEAKDYIRVDTTDDDTLITSIIKQARIYAENYMSRDIVAKDRSVYLPYVAKRFLLPFSPIASITSVTVDGSATTAYETFGLLDDIISLNSLPSENVKVRYVTEGLNDELIKGAVLQLVATFYDNRSDFYVGEAVNEIPTEAKRMLDSFKSMFI
jgi:hypothetical protein